MIVRRVRLGFFLRIGLLALSVPPGADGRGPSSSEIRAGRGKAAVQAPSDALAVCPITCTADGTEP